MSVDVSGYGSNHLQPHVTMFTTIPFRGWASAETCQTQSGKTSRWFLHVTVAFADRTWFH